MIKWDLSLGCKDSPNMAQHKSINVICLSYRMLIYRIRDQNHMIIITDTEKTFKNIQYYFIIFKKPRKLDTEIMFLEEIYSQYNKEHV
jgi:hypothetical protein